MQCDDCNFYRIRTYGTDQNASQAGECRFSDPVPQGGLGVWPKVKTTDWCGKWEAITTRENRALGEVPL